jgi:osmotically-inducible protein OsmY
MLKRMFGAGAALGGLFAFLFDPQSGKRRRRTALDRTMGVLRRSGRRTARTGRHMKSQAFGMKQRMTHRTEAPRDHDDVTLARKVETIIFRDAEVPKGRIDVNVQKGVVQLRGEAPTQQMIDDLESRARDVQGIRDVENLLHLPSAQPRMHQ